jgi:hypothetical protein
MDDITPIIHSIRQKMLATLRECQNEPHRAHRSAAFEAARNELFERLASRIGGTALEARGKQPSNMPAPRSRPYRRQRARAITVKP